MLKILRWNVLIRYNPGKFFLPVTDACYLSGIFRLDEPQALVPQFSADEPILYSRRDARFLVRELRRVGYNAYRRPWIIFAVRQRIAARRNRVWK